MILPAAVKKMLISLLLLALLGAACNPPPRPDSQTPTPTEPPVVEATPTRAGMDGGDPFASDPSPLETSILLPPDGMLPPDSIQPQDATQPAPVEPKQPAPCGSAQGCPRLVITQAGQASQVQWADGVAAPLAPQSILPVEQSRNNRWIIDTGSPSPDGKWVAFTSIGYESGGPVFLQNLETGDWTNIIETVNILLTEGRAPLPEDHLWDVIGWFPDSHRLLIGPVDMSFVAVVDISTFSARLIAFPGSGRGGRGHVGLAADGSHFVYVGENAAGAQVLSAQQFATGDTTVLREVPYSQGILSNPRPSPDGEQVAYVRQLASATPGAPGSVELFSLETGQVRPLAAGGVWMTVPAWSPDGAALAFTLGDPAMTSLASKETQRGEEHANVFVASLAEGTLTQMTYIDGLARSPTWAPDGQSLAFVADSGLVGLVNMDQPGQIWQAAAPSARSPELTSVYFVP